MFFAFAQTIFVKEAFDPPTPPHNSTTLPSGWTNTAILGVLSWGFGFPSAPASFDIDGSNIAFFDDEALGPLGTNNTAELKTPIFNNQFANIILLSFDYFFREVPITLDSSNVQVYNGASWITVFAKSTNACPFYRGGLRCPYRAYPKEIIDITAHKNSNCQVRFVFHDGNVKAYYVGIDNVRIYEPISTSIDKFVVERIVQISPNPSKGNFNLNVVEEQVGKQYQIFDMKGSIVKAARISATLSKIELSNVNKGIYFLKIEGVNKIENLMIQ